LEEKIGSASRSRSNLILRKASRRPTTATFEYMEDVLINRLLDRIPRDLFARTFFPLWVSELTRSTLKCTHLCCLLFALFTCSFFAQELHAQTPDFSKVDDILRGKRTLLQITDLQVIGVNSVSGLNFTQIPVANSTPTAVTPVSTTSFVEPGTRSVTFSGWMFNQPKPVTVALFRDQGGATYTYKLLNTVSSLPDNNTPMPQDQQANEVNDGVTADFNADGYDDLALAYKDGRMQVLTATDVNNPFPQFPNNPLTFGPAASFDPLTSVATGDFNGDGQPEIAGLAILPTGGLKLVIYTVEPSSLSVTATSSLILTTPGATAATPITHVAIARGKFSTLSHDQLAVTFATNSGPSTVEIIDFAPSSPLTPVEVLASAFTASKVTIPTGYLQIKTGGFSLPDNPYDQIVWHMSSTSDQGRFFEVISVDSATLTLTAHSGVTYNQFPCASGIQTGNFDHQTQDPTTKDTERDPTAQIAFMYCSTGTPTFAMNIYSVNSTTFDVITTPDSAVSLPSAVGNIGASFLATDLQGRSMVLGAPNKLSIVSERPTIITAAPPMHIDYVSLDGVSPPKVVNFSYIPGGFNSAFSLTQTTTTGASTTQKLSWSAGADESTSASFQVGDPDKGASTKFAVGFHAAQDFTGGKDNSDASFSASTYTLGTATSFSDVVFFNDSRVNIWVYPVLGQKVCPAALQNPNCSPDQQVPLTLQFSGPDQVTTGNNSAETVTGYQPPWEPGSIFSYPATKEQLALIYPDLSKTQLSSDTTFFTGDNQTSIGASWSSGANKGQTLSTANNFSFDATTSVTSSVGLGPVLQAKFKGSVKLSGSVGFSTLQTNTASMDSTDGITISAKAQFPNPGLYKYSVLPVILGSPPPAGVGDAFQLPSGDIQTFGPLQSAFVVDPIITGSGTWWTGKTSAYKKAPDIALNHPNRWIYTNEAIATNLPSNCGNTGQGQSDVDCADIAPPTLDDPWNSQFLWMKGFFITSADQPGVGPQLGFAKAGDKLDLGVRVYNYSLASMPTGTQVHVRFYGSIWNNSSNTPTNSFLIGETVADEIPPFNNDQGSPLNWKVVHTTLDTTPYTGQSLAFWVVVWMADGSGNLVQEIPGHGLSSVPGALTALTEVPIEYATNTQNQPASYSNNVGFYPAIFSILGPDELGAPAPGGPANITLATVFSEKKRIKRGEVTIVSAVLKTMNEAKTSLKVYFYDGDPDRGGELISRRTAVVSGNSLTEVSIPYHAPSDGVHRIFAVINAGQNNQAERHTSAIIVGRGRPDRYESDGDDPPKGWKRHGYKNSAF
jgi:FG-GAP-like repeat